MLPARFRRFLVPVFVFGLADFSHVLLVLAATMLLAPAYGLQSAAASGVALYAVKNAAGAIAALPAGALGDRLGHRRVLVVGYFLGVLTMFGFLVLFLSETRSPIWLGVLFALGGIYVAVQEALEPAITADLVPDRAIRGTAMGTLATVNGIGDFVASLAFGELVYQLGPAAGFGAAAVVMLLGTIGLASERSR
jgi:MFS family permease